MTPVDTTYTFSASVAFICSILAQKTCLFLPALLVRLKAAAATRTLINQSQLSSVRLVTQPWLTEATSTLVTGATSRSCNLTTATSEKKWPTATTPLLSNACNVMHSNTNTALSREEWPTAATPLLSYACNVMHDDATPPLPGEEWPTAATPSLGTRATSCTAT
ncbi:hypothetical protein Y032_0133g1775 [Ancylostoma ceylanicum]|uniref:Uncharacterized protein n=1 Tax=Ancylostoma ceylanicum TaxID=53326 RepID=A0A016T5H5_9BILA|nr:hypothetical protein Y032_0133g1775 [Ancylostoma ceylanicum]